MPDGLYSAIDIQDKIILSTSLKTWNCSKGDLTGNKIADKITSAGKTNKNTKEIQQNKRQEIYIPPAKRQTSIRGNTRQVLQEKQLLMEKQKNLNKYATLPISSSSYFFYWK